MKKYLCFFAGFDKNGIVHDYVLYYLQKLSEYADIYYLMDYDINNKELVKIIPFVKKAFAYKHLKYDFGSWQELTNKIGWQEIERYESLIFANDSCYAPVFSFDEMFKTMEGQKVDFWGITENRQILPHHLQSYFIVFNKNIIKSNIFRNFIKNIKEESHKQNVVSKYEFKLTKLLFDNGFSYKAFMDLYSEESLIASSCYEKLIKKRCPFFKIKQFTLSSFVYPNTDKCADYNAFSMLKKTEYPVELIKKHLGMYNIRKYFFKLYIINKLKKRGYPFYKISKFIIPKVKKLFGFV